MITSTWKSKSTACLSLAVFGGLACGTNAPQLLPASPLLQATSADSGFCFALNPCGNAGGGFTESFTPAAASRRVTVTVDANLTASRPFVEVVDPFGGVVASSVLNPSNSTAQISFSPTSTGMHILNVCDCGPISPSYEVSVMQSATPPAP